MKHRHKVHRKAGGKAEEPENDIYAGAESNVAKEAEERKHGGAAKHKKEHLHGEGHKGKHRADKPHRKHGGQVPGRARGGSAGADMRPLTTASKVKHVTKGEQEEHGVYDGKGVAPSED